MRRTIAAGGDCLLREGDYVRFGVPDIFLPAVEQLGFMPDQEIEGVIIQFSDSGGQAKMFASVAVVYHVTVVVPIEKLHLIQADSPPQQ